MHIATGTTQTLDHFNGAMDLLAKAHSDRFEAERLFAVFNQLDIPIETLMATTSFTTFDTDYLAVHPAP